MTLGPLEWALFALLAGGLTFPVVYAIWLYIKRDAPPQDGN